MVVFSASTPASVRFTITIQGSFWVWLSKPHLWRPWRARWRSQPPLVPTEQPARVPAPLQPWGLVMVRTQALGCTLTGLCGRHPKMWSQLHYLKRDLLKKLSLHEFEWKQYVWGHMEGDGLGSLCRGTQKLYREVRIFCKTEVITFCHAFVQFWCAAYVGRGKCVVGTVTAVQAHRKTRVSCEEHLVNVL